MRPLARAAIAIGAAGIASTAYQRAAEAVDRRRFPPPGHLADIGGRRIHLLVRGDGSHAVVIVPALGSNVLEWMRVQRAAATSTTVCVCDRAGIGWSDPPPRGPLTFDAMAGDLHAALKVAGIGPPYVIGGHSLGGIAARRFQARYPDDVAGMLLVDSSHEDQSRRFSWRRRSGSHLWRANRWWPGWPVWARMQDELAALSSDSVHMTAVKAGHDVHLDEHVLVVQAIRDLVERCRVAGSAPQKAAQAPSQEGTL